MSDFSASLPQPAPSGWSSFWNCGRWWKAFLIAFIYLVLYRLAGVLALLAFGVELLVTGSGHSAEPVGPLGGLDAIFFTLVLPLVIGSAILVGFVASVRWFPVIFGPQPIKGRWWMWIAVVLVVAPIVLRLIGIDYALYGAPVVLVTFLGGLFVGFSEELLFRGIVIRILRSAGHRELGVAVLSALLFALSHSVNILSGQSILVVGVTVVYTFGFGIMMYLVLRVTGSIVWPMILHALTDPTTMLATGGIDAGNVSAHNPFLAAAGPFNLVFIIAGLLALLFIRGKAEVSSAGLPVRGRTGG